MENEIYLSEISETELLHPEELTSISSQEEHYTTSILNHVQFKNNILDCDPMETVIFGHNFNNKNLSLQNFKSSVKKIKEASRTYKAKMPTQRD